MITQKAYAPFDPQLARRLLRRYLGAEERRWDVRFKDALTDPDSLLVRFVPKTVVVRDVSYQVGDQGVPKQ